MTDILKDSLPDMGKIISAIFAIIGPSIAIYLYFPSHGGNIDLTYQYIIDYAFFLAILFIFYLLNKIDKHLDQIDKNLDLINKKPPQ